LPALKQTLAIVLGLRAKLKAIVSIHGDSTPFALGFKLEHLNQVVDYLEQHTLLCETVVSKLLQAKREIQQMLVYFNSTVIKIHYQLYE